ncbi:MAG TPA: peptidyl-prolyl cis-trans isomerase [Pyrinomonadaceae bacterium]|jgi:peptidyl-prolyl cis-trans isomerase D
MLKQLSRLERTRSLIIVVFAVLMGLSLVFFYAPNRNANVSPATNTEPVAEVNDEEITVRDVVQRKERYQQMFGGQVSLASLGGNRRVLDGLIGDRVVSQEAVRLGLAPSDAEVADAIRKQFSDASGKFVGFDRYKESVISQFGNIEQFEQQIRDSIAAKKLRAYITAGVTVSDEEVQKQWQRRMTTFDLVYVPVAAEALSKNVTVSDEDLQKYFDEHKEEFRFKEPQKKIRYLYIDQEKVGQKMQISDADLRAEYDKISPENKQAGVRVQQIVLKVARPELDAEILQKASELTARLRDDKQMGSEEAFAEAARGNSEDPATALKGGWLPNLVKKDAKNPNDILQTTLTMQPGQVGDPLKTGNAYYIFRRGDTVVKTFEEARPELLVSLRNRQSYRAAADLAGRVAARLKETKDAQKVAEELAGEANMSASEMVRETPFVKPGDDVPNIGSAPQFEEAIAPLNNPNDVGERVGVKGGFAVPMLVERRDPRVPDFAEVREQVAERAKEERAKTQVEQTARDLASNSANADALKAAAEKLGLKADVLPSYRVGTPFGEDPSSPEADAAIFNLKAGEISRTPVKIDDRWVVLGATKRTDADLAEFAKQREQLIDSSISERRTQVFEDYLGAARQRFEREGKIRVYDEVLARLEDEEPPAAAPPTRGLPVPPTGG